MQIHQFTSFDPASSHSAKPLSCLDKLCSEYGQCANNNSQCGFWFRYIDGSQSSGYYLEDILQSSSANTSIIFGCSTSVKGPIFEGGRAINGIFGFGQGHSSVLSQLISQKVMPNVFSHCLRGDEGGIVVLGEIMHPNMVYSPLIPTEAYYKLDLHSISVNDQIIAINQSAFKISDTRGTIIDSGTTLVYLVPEVYDPFIIAITNAISQHATLMIFDGDRHCYKLPNSGAQMFPRVAFNFEGGASMILMPNNYLVMNQFIDGQLMCIGIRKSIYSELTILGDLVLKDKIVVYDLSHQRLGWTDYDCSMEVNVSQTYGKELAGLSEC
ncbi:aspartic proteinase 39-like [Impatiens glandulifera]|uniref:aspartic proteinase 39-like n=1 Tax=Impatiens glandulifera TaxID=253017 RepID=UPI001FB084F5|nr:aspartic proteinase 39-like [Impatiens glandulifera]